MEIIISNSYEAIRRKIGISVLDIKNTIQTYDRSHIVNLNQLEINTFGESSGNVIKAGFYLKKFIDRVEDYYMLVCTREVENQTIFVESAYLLNKDVDVNLDIHDPYEILREFVNKFGIVITFGDTTDKFIFYDYVPYEDISETPLTSAMFPLDHYVIVFQFIKRNSDKKYLICALAYAIDITIYLDWLKKFPIFKQEEKLKTSIKVTKKEILEYITEFMNIHSTILKEGLNYQIKSIISLIGGSLILFEYSEKPYEFIYEVSKDTINEALMKLPQNVFKGDISNIWFAGTNKIREKNRLIIFKDNNTSKAWSKKEAKIDAEKELIDIQIELSRMK